MFLTPLTPQQLIQFEGDFSALNTIDEQYEFWGNVLLRKYTTFVSDYPQFTIKPKSPIEFEKLNDLIFQTEVTQSIGAVFADPIYNFENFCNIFQREFSEVVEKKRFILSEITKIQDEINLKSRPEVGKLLIHVDRFAYPTMDEQYQVLLQAYRDYYLNGKKLDLTREVLTPYKLIPLNNGFVLAQYHKYLEFRLESLNEQRGKKELTSLPKQLLLLYYLGFLDKFEVSNIKKSELFSTLLNGDKENIRKALPNFIGNQLRDLKNKKHLEEIAKLFEDLGLVEQYHLVQKDIDRIKKGK